MDLVNVRGSAAMTLDFWNIDATVLNKSAEQKSWTKLPFLTI